MMAKPEFLLRKEPQYTEFEQLCLARNEWFTQTNNGYDILQSTKPRTLGFAMHDSPVGMLAWMADKLFLWSDDYPWTRDEIITWTLLHYFPGPTTGLYMYFENNPPELMVRDSFSFRYMETPMGFSAFPKELGIVPRSWAETLGNVVFWKNHEKGGHFAMYERPEEMVDDLTEFYRSVWEKEQ
jgi:hypothetical protein